MRDFSGILLLNRRDSSKGADPSYVDQDVTDFPFAAQGFRRRSVSDSP